MQEEGDTAHPLTRVEFIARLSAQLTPMYLDRHPFMQLFYKGELSRKQVRAWIVNRFYLQNNIGSKDAAILSNCPVPEVRRLLLTRSVKRAGLEGVLGDVEGYLELAEAAGLRREAVLKARYLPGVRFAVNELVNFAKRVGWVEGISTSLYETLARGELAKRVEALRAYYSWIRPEGRRFFLYRLGQVKRDSEVVLDLVMKYGQDRRAQEASLAAAATYGEVVWAIHDALYMNYVVQDSPLVASL